MNDPLEERDRPLGSAPAAPTRQPEPPAEASPGPDVGEAWRAVGLSLGTLGAGVGEALRDSWEQATVSDKPASAPDWLRRLADTLERSFESARAAATSPTARERVNEDARRTGESLDRAVRTSIAELGRSLQRVEPKEPPR